MIKSIALRCLFVLIFIALISSCAEKSLTTDPIDNPVDTVPAPLITSISPNPAAIGAELTIDGENFGSDASAIKVYIGDVEVEVKSVTPTKIIVVVPDGAEAGKGAVKVVKGGKSAQGGDSLSVLASPFPFRYATVSISGVTVEMEVRNDTSSPPSKEEILNYQFAVDGDTCFSIYDNSRNPCEEGGEVKNGKDRVAISCHEVLSYAHGDWGSARDNNVLVVIDTINRTFQTVEISDSIMWRYPMGLPMHRDDIYHLGIENVPYSIGPHGEMIAEVKGSDLTTANLMIYRKTYGGPYDNSGKATEFLRIVSIASDAVVRIVLYNDGPL